MIYVADLEMLLAIVIHESGVEGVVMRSSSRVDPVVRARRAFLVVARRHCRYSYPSLSPYVTGASAHSTAITCHHRALQILEAPADTDDGRWERPLLEVLVARVEYRFLAARRARKAELLALTGCPQDEASVNAA